MIALTRQRAIERFLPGVTSHVRFQSIPTGMRQAFSRTISPLACVFLLPRLNMFVMYMLHQPVHILQIPSITAIPGANRHLLVIVIILWSDIVRRIWNFSVCVRGLVDGIEVDLVRRGCRPSRGIVQLLALCRGHVSSNGSIISLESIAGDGGER